MPEYQYICRRCEGIYTTEDIGLPLCRECWRETGLSRVILHEMFGYPKPTPAQEIKNMTGVVWKRKIREQHDKLRRKTLDKK